MSQVSYGTITITDTTDKTVYIAYASNTQGENFSPNPSANLQYVGINISTLTSMPPASDPNWVWSKYAGTDGVSVTSVTEIYQLRDDSTTPAKRSDGTALPAAVDTVNTWSLKIPPYVTGGIYWTSTAVTMSGGTTPIYTTPVKDEGLTDANKNAAIANSIAQHASEDAQGALSQAAAAQQQVTQIDTLLGGHFLWHGSALSTNTKAGARVVEQIKENGTDVSSNPAKWHHNVNIGADGIQLRYNEAVMAQLAANQTSGNTALKFYKPPTISGSTTTQGALAMELTSSALNFYGSSTSTPDASLSSTGLNLAKGSITLGDYFSVTNTGVLTAKSGTIGGWNFTDAALYYSNATPGYSTTNLVVSKSSAVNTNAIAGSETNKHWFLAAGRKFGVDTEGNLYANGGKIGDFTIANDLHSGTTGIGQDTNVYVSPGTLAPTDVSIADSAGGLNWAFTAGERFGVTTDGTLYASNAVISGAITVQAGSNLSAGLGDYSTTADMNTAINTATGNLSTAVSNTYATKTEAVVKEQRIYRRFTSAQSTFSGLNTWVTSGNGYTAWSTSVPQLTNGTISYPFLYMSTQTQTATQAANNGTSCDFTTPQLNAMTTVIDGNSIIANSIAAGKINVENLQALSADMGTLTAGKITKGNNTIDFDNGTLEFRNQSTWAAATQGIKYDSTGLAIKGAITATSLTIASGASVSGVVVPSQIANMATQTDITNIDTAAQGYADKASYSVEIKVTSIDYSANTATLTAVPFYQGGAIPSGTTLTYTWYKDSVASENIVGSNSNTLNVTDTTDMGLDGTYICVISK